jgi:hypothetical protein
MHRVVGDEDDLLPALEQLAEGLDGAGQQLAPDPDDPVEVDQKAVEFVCQRHRRAEAIFRQVGGEHVATKKAAFVGLATFAVAAALAAPAEGAEYAASVQMPHGPVIGRSSISGYGKEVAISTFGSRRSSLFASYSGPGRTTRHGVFGRLGRFGAVALRFEPEGKPKRMRRPSSCTGGPRVWLTWSGTFRGSVRFAPDANLAGFARAGSFAGTIGTVPRWHCRQEAEDPPKFDPDAGGVDVGVFNCDGRDFQANVEIDPATPPSPDEPPTPANFSASWTKSVGIAQVTYSISVEGGPATAFFDDTLSKGTIKPPPPFHGEASILRQGDGWAWTGSLSARFPGRTVSLTGPGFEPHVTTFKPRPYTSFLFAYSVRC